jgi:type III secretion protein J
MRRINLNAAGTRSNRARLVRTAGLARTACLALLASVATGCAVPIAGGLEEGDANRVVVALDQTGVDAVKEADPGVEGKYRVMVPRDEASRALATMADEQLPRARSRGVLDAADRGQLVPSQAAEHAHLVAGLSGDLEKTLGNLDGVLAARVHMNLPPRDALRDGPPAKATASVLVEHRGTTPPLTAEAIARLVSGGAPGLAPADVAVVFVPHAARPAGGRAELAHVGPIAVARGSTNLLRAALAGLVLLVVALAAATLALYARLARAQREREEASAAAARGARTSLVSGAPMTSTRPPGVGPGP